MNYQKELLNIKPIFCSVEKHLSLEFALDKDIKQQKALEYAVENYTGVDWANVYPIISYDDWTLYMNYSTGELLYLSVDVEFFQKAEIVHMVKSDDTDDQYEDYDDFLDCINIDYSNTGESDDLQFMIAFMVKENLVKPEAEVLRICPTDPNAILVYREAGSKNPEGWYAENIISVAQELMTDESGQFHLREALDEAKFFSVDEKEENEEVESPISFPENKDYCKPGYIDKQRLLHQIKAFGNAHLAAAQQAKSEYEKGYYTGFHSAVNTITSMIEFLPSLSGRPCEQIKWERDIAIRQLNEYGISFGEKVDVEKVVRCKNCKYYTNNIGDNNLRDGYCNRREIGNFAQRLPDDFCSKGEEV